MWERCVRGLYCLNWQLFCFNNFIKKLFIFVFIWLCCVLVAACGIFSCGIRTFSCGIWDLVPWPRIESRPPALGAQSLSHWAPGESLKCSFLYAYRGLPCGKIRIKLLSLEHTIFISLKICCVQNWNSTVCKTFMKRENYLSLGVFDLLLEPEAIVNCVIYQSLSQAIIHNLSSLCFLSHADACIDCVFSK